MATEGMRNVGLLPPPTVAAGQKNLFLKQLGKFVGVNLHDSETAAKEFPCYYYGGDPAAATGSSLARDKRGKCVGVLTARLLALVV